MLLRVQRAALRHDPAEIVLTRPNDVPDAPVREERVRVDRPLPLLVAADRVVRELDRALLRDRALELSEAARHLRRVVGVAYLDAHGRLRRPVREAGPAEGEVLQRESQRFGVRELALEE